jgi:hypothetical protein
MQCEKIWARPGRVGVYYAHPDGKKENPIEVYQPLSLAQAEPGYQRAVKQLEI